MEPLPKGANFVRAKMLWEIGLNIAGDPNEPYTGNRDICVSVGSGSADQYRPYLRMSTGSPILAHAVMRGDQDMAFVNPSGFVTQMYRGTGLFEGTPLPVRVVASYPSWDRYVHLMHPRTGLTSLAQVKEQRYPLRVSIREDPTHSTRVLLDQILRLYGFSLDDLVGWGGRLQLNGGPGDQRRLDAVQAGEVDAVFDEGLVLWFDPALAAGMQPMPFEPEIMRAVEALGWRRVTIPAGRYPHLTADYECIDYSGWPLYTRESMPDEVVYKVCDAIVARQDEIPWDRPTSFTDIGQPFRDSEATPLDVPLHPAAAQWCRDHGYAV
jgi:TRAP-type uncharacterized transport system substrate-binding protein